jgi:membrane-associated phospholipid phosphatase
MAISADGDHGVESPDKMNRCDRPCSVEGAVWSRRDRVPLGSLTCTVLSISFGDAICAQDVRQVDVPEGAVVLSKTNLVLASIIFVPLLFMEPLEELDESLSPATVGSPPALRDFGRMPGEPLVGLALTGGTTLVGAMIDNDEVRSLGVSSLKALALAEVAALTLKIAVGRSRPYRGTDPDMIRPFVFDRDQFSFPSGHTAHAFALATVLSRRYGDSHGWIPFVTYVLASTMAVSPVLERKHWATDVVAGAAVGILAGRLVGGGWGRRGKG